MNLVLRIMEAYSSGDYTAVPSGTYGGASYSSSASSYSSAINKAHKQAKVRKAKQKQARAAAGRERRLLLEWRHRLRRCPAGHPG